MKISIITVCFNSEQTVEDTINSVLYQSYKNYEYIIVDGKSTDNTVNIIKKYEPLFNGKLKYISEKDSGLYDAMNKGIKIASGDIIGIINADDILANNNIFNTVINSFKDNVDYIYSDILYCNDNFSKVIRKFKSGEMNSDLVCIAHPTLYLRKSVFNSIGYYNQSYKISADYDFMLRLYKKKFNYIYLKNKYLVLMRIGGVSSNGIKGYLKNFKDSKNVLKNNNIKFPYIKISLRSIKTIAEIINGKIFKNKNIGLLLRVKEEIE